MTWYSTTKAALDISVEFDKLPTKQRPRWSRRSSHVYTPQATSVAEQAISSAWADSHGLGWSEWRGPVEVHIAVAREVAKRANRREEHRLVCVKPDLDNTAKLVLDALNGVAFHDDQQVVRLSVSRKRRGPRGASASIYIQVLYLDDREVVG